MSPRHSRSRHLWIWLESALTRRRHNFYSLSERKEFERRLDALRSKRNVNHPV